MLLIASRPAYVTAIAAAMLFVLAVLVAVVFVPGYRLSQHPLVLVGTVPGMFGWAVRLVGFVLPGLLVIVATMLLPSSLVAGCAGRLATYLCGIAGGGFSLMGLLTIPADRTLDTALQGQAVAWLLWLAAAVPAMLLMAVGMWRRSRGEALVCAALGLLMAVVSLLPLPGVPGPLAQLLAWGWWFFWWAWLARLGAR